MAMRCVGAMLALFMTAWTVGCMGAVGAQVPRFDATGNWAGRLTQGTQEIGFLGVEVDAQGNVVEGFVQAQGFAAADVKQGSVSPGGCLSVDFQGGARLRTTYLTKSADGNTITGSGTLTAPDGTQRTVSFTLFRKP